MKKLIRPSWITYRIWETDELIVEMENTSNRIRLEMPPEGSDYFVEIEIEEFLAFVNYFVDGGYKELIDAIND